MLVSSFGSTLAWSIFALFSNFHSNVLRFNQFIKDAARLLRWYDNRGSVFLVKSNSNFQRSSMNTDKIIATYLRGNEFEKFCYEYCIHSTSCKSSSSQYFLETCNHGKLSNVCALLRRSLIISSCAYLLFLSHYL